MSRRLIVAVACIFALGACVRMPWRKPIPKARPVHFPSANFSDGTKREPKRVGSIAMVNGGGGFVLIEADAWSAPAAGTALKCFRAGVETGVVAVGAERRGAFVTADIVKGAPQRGDEVFQ